MSKLKPLNPSFLWLSASVLLASGLALTFGKSTVHQYASGKAQALISAGDRAASANPQQALADYNLAEVLDSSSIANTAAANLYLVLDRPDDAIATLKRHLNSANRLRVADIQFQSGNFNSTLTTLHQINPTSDTAILKTKTLLELNHPAEATQASDPTSNPTLTLLHGLSLLVSDRTADAQTLITSLGSAQPAQTLQLASTSKVALAKVLFAQGLLNSSERTIKAQLDTSEAYLLLAQINLASLQPTSANFTAAINNLQQGLALDPANLALHQLLFNVYGQVGDNAAADIERQLINQLQTGKI